MPCLALMIPERIDGRFVPGNLGSLARVFGSYEEKRERTPCFRRYDPLQTADIQGKMFRAARFEPVLFPLCERAVDVGFATQAGSVDFLVLFSVKLGKSTDFGQGIPFRDGRQPFFRRRRIHFWNGVSSAWEELPSEDSPDTGSVRALIHLPYARLAIFDEKTMEVGQASWYAYKGCDCAASPDYPKGTYLVVTRTDDPTRTVTVKVNDYGPERDVFPDRIIDLDKVAFAKIAGLGAGVIDVRVTLLQ